MSKHKVPADFPSREIGSGLAGIQPKLSMVKHGDRYYTVGNDPHTRHARYEACVDLIDKFIIVARKTKAGKRREMAESAILAQYRDRVLAANWGLDQREVEWIFAKVAERLNWPAPPPIGK
jgi:hypothetical protein